MAKRSNKKRSTAQQMAIRRTPQQIALMEFIAAYKADPANDGNSPTYEEIAQAFGINKATVFRTCRKLEQLGLLRINQQGRLIIPGGRYTPPRRTTR